MGRPSALLQIAATAAPGQTVGPDEIVDFAAERARGPFAPQELKGGGCGDVADVDHGTPLAPTGEA